MLLGTDELTILRGSKFYGTWQWTNSVTGDPEDFAGLTASIKIKNIHEDFEDAKNTYQVGIATVEPLDINGDAFKGRVDISLAKEETLLFAIPEFEDDRYGESGFYAILEILLSTGEVILQAKVRIVESLESETLDFLLDERDEAIIINGKLDNILLRNDEFISTRDNLIDVVIPTAVQTITDLAADIQINKDEITLTKEDVLLMKDNVQNNKDSVESMKLAIETIFDDFDDRFLGVFNEDPLLDNDGEVLKEGTIYYNSIDKELKFYNSVSWDNPTAAAQTYALQASQSASDANASKLAAKTSEDNAKASEEVAIAKANAILNLTIETETLAPNAQATSSYNPLTGVLNIGVPEGKEGAKGNSFIYADFTPEQLLLLKGPTGLNTYEIAVNNGFVGTEQEWLDSFSSLPTVEEIPELPTNKITGLDVTLSQKINISDIQDLLTSTDAAKPLSANQGKVLKDLIDNINTILTSDDTTLDEIQEVVNFIKQNKTDLQNLDLSNIAETTTLKHFTAILKAKLDAIAENANNYTHPANHSPSIITQDSNNRFVSDTEKASWNAKLDASSGVPIGTVIDFASPTAPAGYLKCNGALISRSAYSALFAVIGTTYGVGDGTTTFALPDRRGVVGRGWDDGRGLDSGRVFGSYQVDSYLNHTHTATEASAGAHTHTSGGSRIGLFKYNFSPAYFPAAESGGSVEVAVTSSSSGAHTHTVTVATSTTGSTENRMKNIASLYCIKY